MSTQHNRRCTLCVLGFTMLAALVLASAAPAHAAVTWLQVKSCTNCTATQMQTMAKNTMPIGINFVYDLPHHMMRKYEVYMDSSCRPVGGGNSGRVGGPGTDSGSDPRCNSFKAADEMPVDPAVQATFDALYDAYTVNPTMAAGGKVTRVSNLPNKLNGQPYVPSELAWDYPSRSWYDFSQWLTQQVSSPNSANALAPDLGDYIFGWSVASVNVGVVLGLQPGVQAGLTWDRSTATPFEWCTPVYLDCIEVTITRSNTGVISLTFQGILDIDHNFYPSADNTPPLNTNNNGFPHHGGDHFSDGMRNGGIAVPDEPQCGFAMHPFQTITRQGTQILFVVYSCVPN